MAHPAAVPRTLVDVAEPMRHLFTVAEYEQMGESGLLPDDRRLELLGGEIIEMPPMGPPHASSVARLTHLMGRLGVADRALLWAQLPMVLSDLSMPEPDLALLHPREDFYASTRPRPADVLLLIEVSDTSSRYDRTVKRSLYAAAGIAEYWIIDIPGGVVDVAVEPTPDGYRQIRQAGPGETISPLPFPDLTIPVATLLG